ncbi:MAG: hypothetical protein IJS53_03685 [Clostridia bacterium]|nr:hypothetical protein [Clostridia bacterium]
MWAFFEKTTRAYVFSALFCGVFALVYEAFGHGVWSFFMVFAWIFPLGFGALPLLMLRRCPPAPARWLWRAGIATLTVGSLLQGALEIYGTSHPLASVYPVAGVALCAAGAGWAIVKRRA